MKNNSLFQITLILLVFHFSMCLSAQPQWVSFTTDELLAGVRFQEDYVWYGFRGGLARIHVPTNEVSHFTSTNSGLPDHYIEDIEIAPDGTLWVRGQMALAKYVNGEFITVNPLLDDEVELRYLGKLNFDNQGNLVVCASTSFSNNAPDVIVKIDENDNMSVLTYTSDLEYQLTPSTMTLDQEDQIWYAIFGEVVVVDGDGNTTLFDWNNSPLHETGVVSKIMQSPDGGMTVIEKKQEPDEIFIYTYDGQDWEFVSFEEIEGNGNPFFNVLNAFYDIQGGLMDFYQ